MKSNEKWEERSTNEKTMLGEVGAPPKFQPLVQYCLFELSLTFRVRNSIL